MTIPSSTLSYLLTNTILISENHFDENPELHGFESVIFSKPEKLSGTINVLNKFADKIINCHDDNQEKQLLLDYSAFKHFLIKYYKSGLEKKSDDSCANPYFADKTKYNKTNFNNCFMNQPFVKKYCSNDDVDMLSSEPALLFDDEDCVKSVYEMEVPPIFVLKAIDTQIMAEAPVAPENNKIYQLDQVLVTIGKILQSARSLGSQDLFKSITQLRGALIKLNGRPIPLKYRIFGNQYPPEAFVAWRLEEKLNFFRARGTKILQVIKQAEDDENGITPEEVEDIKDGFRNILLAPSKKFTIKTMGPFTYRAVTNLEQRIYMVSPEQLADDFSEALTAKAQKINAPNPYYVAMQQMFNQIPSAPVPAPKDQFVREPRPNQGTQAGASAPTQATQAGQQGQASAGTVDLKNPQQNRTWMGTLSAFMSDVAKGGPKNVNPDAVKRELQKILNQLK